MVFRPWSHLLGSHLQAVDFAHYCRTESSSFIGYCLPWSSHRKPSAFNRRPDTGSHWSRKPLGTAQCPRLCSRIGWLLTGLENPISMILALSSNPSSMQMFQWLRKWNGLLPLCLLIGLLHVYAYRPYRATEAEWIDGHGREYFDLVGGRCYYMSSLI
jgi:hypothetical protein